MEEVVVVAMFAVMLNSDSGKMSYLEELKKMLRESSSKEEWIKKFKEKTKLDLTKEDEELLKRFFELFKRDLLCEKKEYLFFKKKLSSLLDDLEKGLGEKLSWEIWFYELSPYLENQDIEDIMINNEENIFVYNSKEGFKKLPISFDKQRFLSLLRRLENYSGRKISPDNPVLETRLPDGSRAIATLKTITPEGDTLTIRKFRQRPYSITELISNGTISSEVAAYLWIAIEGFGLFPQNILIIGGTASGKTTLLNALLAFIRRDNRIITIEDTRELNLYGKENWVAMETFVSQKKEIEMNDLLKAALRMRPDWIVVGEVRGKEARTLFAAMDVGHSCMGTLHANNPKELLIRLSSDPMNVPRETIPLLNIVVNLKRQYINNKSIRRIFKVSEFQRLENDVVIGDIFTYDRNEDKIVRTKTPISLFDKLSRLLNMDKKDILDEFKRRQEYLETLVDNKIYDNFLVVEAVEKYLEGLK